MTALTVLITLRSPDPAASRIAEEEIVEDEPDEENGCFCDPMLCDCCCCCAAVAAFVPDGGNVDDGGTP